MSTRDLVAAFDNMPSSMNVREIEFEPIPPSYCSGVRAGRGTVIGGLYVVHMTPVSDTAFKKLLSRSEYEDAECTDFQAEIPDEHHEFRYGIRFKPTAFTSSKALMDMFFSDLGEK